MVWSGECLWSNAMEQANVAATNAVGKVAFVQGCGPVTSLKCLGMPLISIGDILEDGEGIGEIKHFVKFLYA